LAKIPELDFVAQGQTLDEAKANLFEVVKIQFDEMREQGSLVEYLSDAVAAGIRAGRVRSRTARARRADGPDALPVAAPGGLKARVAVEHDQAIDKGETICSLE
jgi:hypothetical protein